MKYINTTKLTNIDELIEHFYNGDTLYAGDNNQNCFKFPSPQSVSDAYTRMCNYFKDDVTPSYDISMTPMPILAETFAKKLRSEYFANNGQFWKSSEEIKTVYNAICNNYLWQPQSVAYKTGYFKGNFYDFDMVSAFTNITMMLGRIQLDRINYNTGEILQKGNVKFLHNPSIDKLTQKSVPNFEEILKNDTQGIIGIDGAVIKHSAIRQLVTKCKEIRDITFPCSHPTRTIYISLSVLRVLIKHNLISEFTIKHGIYINRDVESSKNMKDRIDAKLKDLGDAFDNKQPGFVKLFRNISTFGLICGGYDNGSKKHDDRKNEKFLRLHGFMVHGMMQAILLEMTLKCNKFKNLEMYAHSIDGFIISASDDNLHLVQKIWSKLDSIKQIKDLVGENKTLKLKRGGRNLFQPEAGFALTQYPLDNKLTQKPVSSKLTQKSVSSIEEIISYKYICRRKAKGKTNNEIISMILTHGNIHMDYIYGEKLLFTKDSLKNLNNNNTPKLKSFKTSNKSTLTPREFVQFNVIVNDILTKGIISLTPYQGKRLLKLIENLCSGTTITDNELSAFSNLYDILSKQLKYSKRVNQQKLFNMLTVPPDLTNINQFCPKTGLLYSSITKTESPINIHNRYGVQYLNLVQFSKFTKRVIFKFENGTKEAKQFPLGAYILNTEYRDDILFKNQKDYARFRYIFYEGVYTGLTSNCPSRNMYMLRYYAALQGKIPKHEVFVDGYIEVFDKFVASVRCITGAKIENMFLDLSKYGYFPEFEINSILRNEKLVYPPTESLETLPMSPHVCFFIQYVKSNDIDIKKAYKKNPITIFCICKYDNLVLSELFRMEVKYGHIILNECTADSIKIFKKYNYTLTLSLNNKNSKFESYAINKVSDYVRDKLNKLNSKSI